ncbi:hypothetical protein EUTSA_v10005926mg [Eutrema salsugineum]|uniref:FBD domain-containing protein n=1 Tax=Eutrema salsugineum TaxID=72664 RepID=V4LWD1_EUTSA|nr:hypothetical protein EUTSA_v10005926mg [Eutrema salsugineum]
MDRVSSRPDELLCHVLSFLPTKQAALTPVLSKRWLNLWKLVPNLDIDDSVFLHPEEGKGERDGIRQSFVDFVDRVLAMQGDSPIKNFSLKCITCVHPDIVNRWIRNVLRRGVSDLDLFIDFSWEDIEETSYYLPEEMFLSGTLVKLKLRSERSVDWWHEDMGSSLPMLKSLDIDSEMIFCDDIEKFLPSFPWRNFDVTVSSASLRKLSLHGTGCEGLKPWQNPKSFSFDTPSLLYLNYSEFVAEDYPLVNMEKLLEARINLMVSDDQIKRVRAPDSDWLEDDEDDEDGEGDVVQKFGNVVKLMNGIHHVQRLQLPPDTLEVLSLCCESMPVFNNLKFLGVESEEDRGWQAMPVLLRSCPHLETIIFQGLLHYVTDQCGDACACISREDKGRSLKYCPVNRIEIQGFRGTMKEMAMIKHFLDYFPCLKRMDVFIEENDPTQLRNHEVSKLVIEMFRLYDKLSSCNVQLLVSDFLDQKWTAQGHL